MQTLSCSTQGVEGAWHEDEAIMDTDSMHLEPFQRGGGVYSYALWHNLAEWQNPSFHSDGASSH